MEIVYFSMQQFWKTHGNTMGKPIETMGTDGNAPLEMLESPVLEKANKQFVWYVLCVYLVIFGVYPFLLIHSKSKQWQIQHE